MHRKNNSNNTKSKPDSIDQDIESLLNDSNDLKHFDDTVFRSLPGHLALLMEQYTNIDERDTILFSALILLSGILPNYQVLYDGKTYEANLFGYVCGSFGSGKGMINNVKELVTGIHRDKRKRAQDKYEQFSAQERQNKRKTKSLKGGLDDTTEKLPYNTQTSNQLPPPDEMLLIPANNTKSNLFKILYENNGRGIICETEAATLTTALKQQHGSFLDLILLSFHHESCTFSRKAERTTEIDRPYLSVLLSSTPKQIFHLFPDIENGLFSRFLFCWTKSSNEFKPVFTGSAQKSLDYISALSDEMKNLYNYLDSRSKDPLNFTFTTAQQIHFQKHFQKLKNRYREIYHDEMDGLIHRLGLIFTRIAMILSIFRKYQDAKSVTNVGDDIIICSKADFQTTISLTNTLLENSTAVYEMLVKNKNTALAEGEGTPEHRLKLIKQSLELRAQRLSYGEIAKQVLKDARLRGTVFKWIQKYGNS